jgi:hypothetical protein
MTDNMIELAKRAVACKGWRLTPGMLDLFGRRVLCVWPDDLGIKWSHLLDNRVVRDADALPDLTDPATLGCVLALVRKAWGDPRAYMRDSFGWEWITDYCVEKWPPGGETEAEALVAALESAP